MPTLPPSRFAALGARLRVLFASPHLVRWAVVVAAVLAIPVLFQGFLGDDHAIRGFLLHTPFFARWAKPPLEVFSFYDGDPGRTRSLVDHGVSPWWTDPSLRIMLFRPLSALTHWIDFRLWPGSPFLMHLHSVGWYLALVAAASALYRRVLGASWIAGFAAMIYVFDSNHGMVVEWISNRNALIGGSLGVLALVFHDRARREEKPLFAVISAASLGLGLLGAEIALGAVGYLAGYALFLDRAPLRARVASLVPHAGVLGGWLLAYRLGGFGARGSGMYVDPGRTPLEFLHLAASRIPLLLQSELGGPAPDIVVFLPHPSPLIAVAAVGIVAVSFVAMWPLRGDPRARFFLAGALLSSVPAAATFPAGRLMILPSIGLLGLVALVVSGVIDRPRTWRPGPARWAALYVAVWVGGGHLVLSPMLLVLSECQMAILERVVARYGDSLGDDPALAGQRVIVVNPPDTFFTYYMLGQRLTRGRVAPAAMMVLAAGARGMDIERRDAKTLIVRSDEGFYRSGTEVLTRSLEVPMPVGTRVELSAVTIEVTRAGEDGVPTEALFTFTTPLEDESLRWVEWQGPTFAPFRFPAIGQSRRIEGQTPSF
ncbi:MAG: hypothetical protein ABJE95_26170 [Byssovorax sp.]